MIKKMLEKAGHEVDIALNGREGMELFEKNKPDLLITDIIMPEKEGLETIFELRRNILILKLLLFQVAEESGLTGIFPGQNFLGPIWFFKNPLIRKIF